MEGAPRLRLSLHGRLCKVVETEFPEGHRGTLHKILWSPDVSCGMNIPDPFRPVSVKQEEHEDQPDLSNRKRLVDNIPPPYTLTTADCGKYQWPDRPDEASSDTVDSSSQPPRVVSPKVYGVSAASATSNTAAVLAVKGRQRTDMHPSSLSVTTHHCSVRDLAPPAAPTDVGEAGQMKKKTAKRTRFMPTQNKTKKETKLEFFGFKDKEDQEGGAAVGHSSSYKIKYFGFDDQSESDSNDESTQAKEKKEAAAVLGTSMDSPQTSSNTDILHMVVCKEEVSPEQERSPSLLQEEPEPPHIKEEQEELLQRPEEPDGSMLTLLAVKCEVDDEHISSHCYEIEVELESDTEVTEDGVRTHSSQIQSFSCSECPSAYTSQIWLDGHIRRKHGKKWKQTKGIKLNKDVPSTTQTSQPNTNGVRSHSSQIQSFSCPECPSAFTSQIYLHQHIRRNRHKKIYIEKKYCCTECYKRFEVPCALKIHQRVRHGEKIKPFHCKDCGIGHLGYRTLAQSAEPLTH